MQVKGGKWNKIRRIVICLQRNNLNFKLLYSNCIAYVTKIVNTFYMYQYIFEFYLYIKPL